MSDINISNTDIVLDLYNNNFVEVTSKQYDKSTRTISALISEYGKVIQIPNGVTAQVRMKKPDGKGIIKDCTISNNKIVIVEDEQMLLFAGRHKVDVVLFTDTQRVSTLSFILVVESAAVSDEDVLSSNEYSALDKALKDCRDTVADINRRLEAGEFNGGPPGTRGSQWTQGTSITGTDTSPTVFNASGISDALVNDCYFNTATGNTYRCVSAGDASQAKWVYTGCLKSISNSSAITEEGQYSIDAVQANPSIEGTLANKQERINTNLTTLSDNVNGSIKSVSSGAAGLLGSGIYYLGSNVTGVPLSSGGMLICSEASSSGNKVQIFFSISTSTPYEIYKRTYNGTTSTWGSWYALGIDKARKWHATTATVTFDTGANTASVTISGVTSGCPVIAERVMSSSGSKYIVGASATANTITLVLNEAVTSSTSINVNIMYYC